MNTPDFIVLHDDDTVATALRDVEAATAMLAGPRGLLPEIELLAPIRLGHKIALRPIAEGELIVKHGHSIGRATAAIAVGEHVHVHNVVSLSALPSPPTPLFP